jgi:hypothetical protein
MTAVKPLHEESVEQVKHALAEVLHEADVAFGNRARMLVRIAENWDVSITDALLPWIRIVTPEKEWSALEWGRWCQRFAEARAELLKRHLEEDTRKVRCRN